MSAMFHLFTIGEELRVIALTAAMVLTVLAVVVRDPRPNFDDWDQAPSMF